MIQYITKGSDFLGAARYVARKDGAERVGGNLSSPTPVGMAAEWSMWTELNDQIEKDVFHVSLSLPAGEELEGDQWQEACETYLERMGFGQSAWVAYRHGDTGHDHVHILANRVDFDGKAVKVWRDHIRGQAVCRQLERDFALKRVPSGRDQLREEELAERLQDRVQSAARACDEMGGFIKELERRRVDVEVRRREDGTPYGISYGRRGDDEMVAGSDIGRAFSWGGLQKRAKISWDRQRDDRVLRRAERELEERKKAQEAPRRVVQRGLSEASSVEKAAPEPAGPPLARVINRPNAAEELEQEPGFGQADTLPEPERRFVHTAKEQPQEEPERDREPEEAEESARQAERERLEHLRLIWEMSQTDESDGERLRRMSREWRERYASQKLDRMREVVKERMLERAESEGFTYTPMKTVRGSLSGVQHFEDGVSLVAVADPNARTCSVVELPEMEARELEERYSGRVLELDPSGAQPTLDLAYGTRRDKEQDRGDDWDMER